jgi:outer membrane lipoprotein-sorting protein
MSPDTTGQQLRQPAVALPAGELHAVARHAVARRAVAAFAALTLSLTLGGCFGSIGKVVKAVHAAVNAAGNLKGLQSEIQKGEKTSYEATYKTTGSGSSSSTITFAQEPGGKYAYIAPSSAGSGGSEFIANGKNQYECTQDTNGAKWSCIQSAEASGSSSFDGDPFYGFTGAYYYTVIEALSVEAAVIGYHVTNSTSSVNGISLKCVSLSGKTNGQSENDEWCVTSDGILGLVKTSGGSSSSSSASSFEITHLTTSPSGSVFQPPSGATITTESA